MVYLETGFDSAWNDIFELNSIVLVDKLVQLRILDAQLTKLLWVLLDYFGVVDLLRIKLIICENWDLNRMR